MGNDKIKRPRGKNTRLSISALLCSVIILNYFDRVAISVAAPEVQKSFELSAFEIGLVFLFGGIVAALLTDVTGSFDLAFIIAAVVLVIGLFFYIVVLGDIRKIELEENDEGKT
jgi:hypothetical protein